MTRLEGLISDMPFLQHVAERSDQTQIATLLIAERLADSSRQSVLRNIVLCLESRKCDCMREASRDLDPVWLYDSPFVKPADHVPLTVHLRCRFKKCHQKVYGGAPTSVKFADLSVQVKWESRLLNALGGLEFAVLCFGGLCHENQTSWYSSVKLIYESIIVASKQELSRIRCDLKSQGKQRQVSFDGGWATRGHSAHQFTFVVVDQETRKIVDLRTLSKKKEVVRGAQTLVMAKGNYDGTSNSMEAQALHDWIAEDPDGFLECVQVLCSDGDTKVPGILEDLVKNKGRIHALDLGHYVKSVGKHLKGILGDKYKQVYKRIQKFLSILIKRVIQEVVHPDILEEHRLRCVRFAEYWAFAYPHYTTENCDPGCPCQARHGPSTAANCGPDLSPIDSDSESSYSSSACGSDDMVTQERPSALSAGSDPDDDEDAQNSQNVSPRVLRPSGNTMDVDVPSMPDHDLMPRSAPVSSRPATTASGRKLIIQPTHTCSKNCAAPCPKAASYDAMCDKLKATFANIPHGANPTLWGCDTTFAEGAHSVRGRFVKKTKAYGSSFESRAHMAALIRNCGYLRAAELIWEALQQHALFVDHVGPLTHLIRDQLHELDSKRLRDSARKKSDDFKRREKKKTRQTAQKRVLETRQPAKGNYEPSWGTVRRASSAKLMHPCPNCGQPFANVGVHLRFCKSEPSGAPAVPLLSQHRSSAVLFRISGFEDLESEADQDSDSSDASSEDGSDSSHDQFEVLSDYDNDFTDYFVAPELLSYDEQLELAQKLSLQEDTERNAEIREELQLLKTALLSQLLYLHDLKNSRDGNCYFHVLAYYLQLANEENRIDAFKDMDRITHLALRSYVVEFMRTNPKTPFIRGTVEAGEVRPFDEWFKAGEWEIYLQQMAKSGVFADDMTIAAASECLRLCQRIYWNDESETVSHTTLNHRELLKIKVGLTLVEKHYYVVSNAVAITD